MEQLKKGRFANLIHDVFTSYEYTRRLYGFSEFISLCGRILEYKKNMDLREEKVDREHRIALFMFSKCSFGMFSEG